MARAKNAIRIAFLLVIPITSKYILPHIETGSTPRPTCLPGQGGFPKGDAAPKGAIKRASTLLVRRVFLLRQTNSRPGTIRVAIRDGGHRACDAVSGWHLNFHHRSAPECPVRALESARIPGLDLRRRRPLARLHPAFRRGCEMRSQDTRERPDAGRKGPASTRCACPRLPYRPASGLSRGPGARLRWPGPTTLRSLRP